MGASTGCTDWHHSRTAPWVFATGLVLRAFALCVLPQAPSLSAHAAHATQVASRPPPVSGEGTGSSALRADFGTLRPPETVRQLADSVVRSRDHEGLPFALVEKQGARLYMFNSEGVLTGSSAVLLGAAKGDVSVPGIGERPLKLIKPSERTTPAGRFVIERGRNAAGEDIVWIDYDDAVSLHRVRTTNPAERRLQRLRSPTARDNRISYGCINVPVAFFDQYIAPVFTGRRGVVYVLPEVLPLTAVFPGLVF